MRATRFCTSVGCCVGGADPHFVVLAGDRERRLSLQIEVLLSADAYAAFEPVGGGGDRR